MSNEEATLNEFIDNSGYSTESGSATEDYQDTGDLQTLETSPIEDWKLVRLDDILSFEYGDNLPANTRQEGSIPVYGSNGQVDTHTEANVDGEGIIIGRKGSIGKGEFSDKPFWAIDTTYYISDEETDENLRFIYYLLQDMELERLNAASAIPGLNRNDAYNLNTLVPPLSEQRKIATVLHTVDQAIQKTEEIIEQTESVRKGIIQSSLSGKYTEQRQSKADFSIGPKQVKLPKSWETKLISDISDIKNGNRVVKGHDYSDEKTQYPFIRIVDMESGTVSTSDIKYLKEETANQMQRGIISSDDVYITVTGRVGDAGTVPSELDGARFTDNAAKLYNLDGVIPEYLSLYLRSKLGQDEVHRFTVGSTQPKLSMYRVEKMEVIAPPLDTQQDIVDTVSKFDSIQEQNKIVRNKLKLVKRGLMQDLLSGTVRTTDTNIDIPEEVAKYG